MPPQTVTGMVFDIQRFCLDDGPGIRTSVFLKGCPLRCRWCHNPEGLTGEAMVAYDARMCGHCGQCATACPAGAQVMEDGRHVPDRSKCQNCFACVAGCPSGAMRRIGRQMTVAEVIAEVERDRPFYETSGGGLTLTGGEPLYQPEFAHALLMVAKTKGLHTCIETCGHADYAHLARLVPVVDLFLYDLKIVNPERHRRFTGVSNQTILANLRCLHDQGAAIVVRIPVIPGQNDGQEDKRETTEFLKTLPNLIGVEEMPHHDLGADKLRHLGISD